MGSSPVVSQEAGCDVQAALEACVIAKDAERLKKVSSNKQQGGIEFKKRGIVKAIMFNFVAQLIFGAGYSGLDADARSECLAAIMDQTISSAEHYACIKFDASLPKAATTCLKRPRPKSALPAPIGQWKPQCKPSAVHNASPLP
jgi:hypothetical protein